MVTGPFHFARHNLTATVLVYLTEFRVDRLFLHQRIDPRSRDLTTGKSQRGVWCKVGVAINTVVVYQYVLLRIAQT